MRVDQRRFFLTPFLSLAEGGLESAGSEDPVPFFSSFFSVAAAEEDEREAVGEGSFLQLLFSFFFLSFCALPPPAVQQRLAGISLFPSFFFSLLSFPFFLQGSGDSAATGKAVKLTLPRALFSFFLFFGAELPGKGEGKNTCRADGSLLFLFFFLPGRARTRRALFFQYVDNAGFPPFLPDVADRRGSVSRLDFPSPFPLFFFLT